MNFFGKKGGKGKRGQAQQQGQPVGEFKFDPSAPDAFSEENLAKVSRQIPRVTKSVDIQCAYIFEGCVFSLLVSRFVRI